MQTFLPYPDFRKSLECLDLKRLGKMRVESYQILNIITGKAKPNPKTGNIAWANHPAVRMWRGYPIALTLYYNLSLEMWSARLRKDGGFCQNNKLKPILITDKVIYPPWWGNNKFHSSHRSTLLYKDFDFYSQYEWVEIPSKVLYWPI